MLFVALLLPPRMHPQGLLAWPVHPPVLAPKKGEERHEKEAMGGRFTGGERATNVYGKPLLWVLLLLRLFCRCRPHSFRGSPAAGGRGGEQHAHATRQQSKQHTSKAQQPTTADRQQSKPSPNSNPTRRPCHCCRDASQVRPKLSVAPDWLLLIGCDMTP